MGKTPTTELVADGHADRVAGVGSVAEHGIVRGDGCDRASGRAAGAEAHIVGIAGASEGRAAIGIARGKIRHVGLPEDDGSGRAQLGDDGRIPGRDQFMAGDHVAFPSIRSDQALDAGVGLGNDRNAPQGAAHETAATRFCFRVLASGGGESSGQVQVLHGAIDPVVLLDARHVPAHDFGNGVFVAAVQLFQLGDGDFEQVAIHRFLRSVFRG